MQPADHTSAQTDRTLGNLLPTSTKDEAAPALSAPHVLTVVLTAWEASSASQCVVAATSTAPGARPAVAQERVLRVEARLVKANEAGIIVSRIDSGARLEYGLHATGREQARAAGDAFKAIVGERPVSPSSRPISAARSRPPRSLPMRSMRTSRPSRRCASGTSATSSWGRTRPTKRSGSKTPSTRRIRRGASRRPAAVLERAAGAVTRRRRARGPRGPPRVARGLPPDPPDGVRGRGRGRASVVAASGGTCELRRLGCWV